VRDFGMGIARHEQRRIFHRFYRSSRAHDRNVSGVGLGLALCRHVIRSHGGWIEVASEVGEGTTFSVYLKCG
jgi:two-component system phosphate regulon sensor histidine kinase PhoR